MKPAHTPAEPLNPADEVRRLLARRATRVVRIADRLRGGRDREAVHDLRVALRRLEAALKAWQDALAPKPLRRAGRMLRQMRRWAGKTRAHEVHAAEVRRAMAAAPTPLQPALGQVAADLEAAQVLALGQLASRLKPARLEKLQRRIRRALRPLAEPAEAFELQRQARDRVEQQRRRALAALLRAHPSDAESTLHDARLRVKRWRYCEEALAATTHEGVAGEEVLRRLQQLLGEIQDLDTLRTWGLEQRRRYTAKEQLEEVEALDWLVTRVESARLVALERFRSVDLPAGDSAPA